MTWLARYSPLSTRSGVISIDMFSGGPILGLVDMIHPRIKMIINMNAPRTRSIILRSFFIFKILTDKNRYNIKSENNGDLYFYNHPKGRFLQIYSFLLIIIRWIGYEFCRWKNFISYS